MCWLVFIVRIRGGWSAFHSEGPDLDHSIEMEEWPGLFQWVRNEQGGSIKNRERGTMPSEGDGGTRLLKRWEWRVLDFSTCLGGYCDEGIQMEKRYRLW